MKVWWRENPLVSFEKGGPGFWFGWVWLVVLLPVEVNLYVMAFRRLGLRSLRMSSSHLHLAYRNVSMTPSFLQKCKHDCVQACPSKPGCFL